MKGLLRTDGGARPSNPGMSAFAAVLQREDGKEFICSRFLGWKTNNYAEFAGLVVGIKLAREFDITELEIICDSQMIVNIVNGKWTPKHHDMKAFSSDASHLLAKHFDIWSIKWEKRTQNKKADHYCTQAILWGMKSNPFTPKKMREKKPEGMIVNPF